MTDQARLTEVLTDAGIPRRRAERCGGRPSRAARFRQGGLLTGQSLVPSIALSAIMIVAGYALFAVSWSTVGRRVLNDRSAGITWALMLAASGTAISLAGWATGAVGTSIGSRLRRRALTDALAADPDSVSRMGVGTRLAIALDLDLCERLGADAGVLALAATIEIALASGAVALIGLPSLSAMLGACVLATAIYGTAAHRANRQATVRQAAITRRVVERLLGHRTELLASRVTDLVVDSDADRRLARLADRSSRRADDRWLASFAIAHVWAVLGFAGVAAYVPSTRAGTTVAAGAVALGAIGLASLSVAMASSSGARLAAARLRESALTGNRSDPPPGPPSGDDRVLVGLEQVTYQYPSADRLAIGEASLDIREGDFVLLTGPSGGGKTTLASLLAGTRVATSGTRRLGQIDDRAVRVAMVPQFHDNHVFSDTLAFNLLCGRQWPPAAADVRRAVDVAHAVGLGPLLDRAPAGVGQPVGDFGWQLSHGERSRLFIARALLQEPDVLIMDESLAALEPGASRSLLDAVASRGRAVVLVAHP